MSNKRLRVFSRWIHIVGAALLGTYLYSPWGSEAWFTALMRWGVMPVLVLTGVAMWKQAQVGRLLRRLSS
ncbi:MAG: hypothetical protein U5L04_00035 [Trueperaceae bacterium]|nr:hypothetical protein [Trueperaceae bacterium]